MSFCCQNGLIIEQIDVETAFLNGKVSTEVYIRQPQGYEDGTDRVCKLVKSMYGLSESPRDWFDFFDEFVTRLGFMENNIDFCVYVHGEGENTLYQVNYVDYFSLYCKNKNKIEKVKNLLSDRFKMKDLGKIKEYLGIKIEYDYENNKMELSETACIESLVEKYKLQSSNLYNTPMETKLKIEKSNYCERDIKYRNLLGVLLYISCNNRPDISYCVNYLSKFQNS